MTTADKVIAAIPSALAALGEIVKLIAALKAASGLTDEELQAVLEGKLSENDRVLLALLAR